MHNLKNKIISIAIITLWLVGWAMPVIFSDTAHALPQNGTVAAGSSTITQPDASTMRINQTTDKSIINWQGYSIGANEKVQYFQPSSSSISLNRVIGADPSLIYGQLNANGQVWVINPNGLLVGSGAQINVGSFLGSTLNINDNDFMNGNYKFRQEAMGNRLSAITNLGNITANNGGYVVLISPSITNEGNITSNLGKTYMASGGEVTLNFAGNDLIGFTIDKAAAEEALGIKNTGTITADGGQVILSAKAAGDVLKTIINNHGIIEAKTIENKNGVIKLLGGMENNAINVGGTLDASAPNGGDGGFIETSAASVKIADNAIITTAASNGKTGTWLIDPTDYTIAASGGDITGAALETNLGTTSVIILSSSGAGGISGNVNVNDTVTWSLNKLTLNAQNNININATMNASGTASLALEYGQGAVAAGNTSAYNVKAPVNMASTSGFSTKLGSDGPVTNYTVITSLGLAGSTTGTDLQGMSGNLAGKYALGSNIDASATSTWNAGSGFLPVGNPTTNFTGVFDGLGHTITGLTINRPATNYIGLFGYTTGAAIRNVGLVGGSVTGRDLVGGLAGVANTGATITNSYSTGAVTGNGSVGGLVGQNKSTITNSYSTGAVTGSSWDVGGLVGSNWSTITNSYSTGAVTGSATVGGLVGNNNTGTINNSYSTGAVTGDIYVGGLAGYNGGTITNSYSTGAVIGSTNVGGLAGYNVGTITNSYWDTQTSGQATSAGGTGLTTAQMMQSANFTGFDFTNVWWLSAGNTRPFLRSEYSTNITNAHQLQLMAMNLGARYTLANNIDLTSSLAAVGGLYPGMWGSAGFAPVGDLTTRFTGTFDGLGHTITGLTINRPDQSYIGLFGFTNGAAIRNVGLVGGSITVATSVGGLAGYNTNTSTITNSYSTGAVTGSNSVGGLVGYNAGTISNSYSTGAVTGSGNNVGGLAGANGGTITNSYSTGAVTGGNYVGGLAGYNNTGAITNSYSTGSVTGTSYVGGLAGVNTGAITDSYSTGRTGNIGTSYVGGLAGYNAGAITNSYSTGSVTGTSDVGGLVGYNNTGAITDSYSTGSVTGDNYVGGLVGYNTGAITNSYSTGSVTGNFFVGGLVGYTFSGGTTTSSYWDTQTSGQATSAGGTGLTTSQMKTMASFAGWNIANTGSSNSVWRIYEGNTYPLLKSFLTPLTITANNASKTYDGLAYSGGNGVTYSLASPVLSGTLTYGGTSQGAINAGSYTITPSGFYSNQQGYDITYANGALTINPAPLTITANAANKTYDGLAYSGGNGVGYTGFVNNETSAVLGGALNYGGTSQGATNAGSYVITPSGLTSGNYAITYNNGALTVNKAALTVTASAATKTYDGLAYSGGNGVAYTGLVNGETSAVLGGALAYGGTSQGAVNAGNYLITPSGQTSGNYTITYVDGVLTVIAASTGGTTTTVDYTDVIQEGLGNFSGNAAAEPAPQEAKYELVYAVADSPVFTYTADGSRPLITDYQPKKKSKRLCFK